MLARPACPRMAPRQCWYLPGPGQGMQRPTMGLSRRCSPYVPAPCTLSLERLSYTGTVRDRGFGLTGAAGASVPQGGSSWRAADGRYRADGTMPCPWPPIREPQRASRRRQGGLMLELT